MWSIFLKVLFEDGTNKVVGVEYSRHGKKKVAYAKKEVIVSAGGGVEFLFQKPEDDHDLIQRFFFSQRSYQFSKNPDAIWNRPQGTFGISGRNLFGFLFPQFEIF